MTSLIAIRYTPHSTLYALHFTIYTLQTTLYTIQSTPYTLHPGPQSPPRAQRTPHSMNCPSRTDPITPDGYNQSPNALNADATTRADMNRVANARTRQDHRIDTADGTVAEIELGEQHMEEEGLGGRAAGGGKGGVGVEERGVGEIGVGRGDAKYTGSKAAGEGAGGAMQGPAKKETADGWAGRAGKKVLAVLRKYAKFVGPGFMVAVAYIDPGMLPLTTCSVPSTYPHLLSFHPLTPPTLTF